LDYPRINQFPEWFTLEKDKNYEITRLEEKKTYNYCGTDLLNGINVSLNFIL